MQSRKTWIDGMKGIAICGVVMVHCGGGNLPSALETICGLGARGVQVFFLVSACLAFLSMEKAFAAGMDRRKICGWILKKFIRLVPLYYLAILIGCITGGSPYWLGSEGHITIPNVLAHCLFVHGLFPHYCNSLASVEWYLGVLAIFYVLAPLLFRVINNMRKAVVAWIGGTLICTFITYVAGSAVWQIKDAYVYANYIGTFSFIAQFPVLLLGIILYYVIKKCEGEYENTRAAAASYTLLMVALVMIAGIARTESSMWGVIGSVMFGLCFFLIALSQLLRTTPLIVNPLFCFLGKSSYPIYLMNYYLVFLYKSVYARYCPALIENKTAAWLVEFMVVLSLSALIARPLIWLSDQVLSRLQFGNADLNV